jgi:hypothetical protein
MQLKRFKIPIILTSLYLFAAIFSKLQMLIMYFYIMCLWLFEIIIPFSDKNYSILFNLIVSLIFLVLYYFSSRKILRIISAIIASCFFYTGLVASLNVDSKHSSWQFFVGAILTGIVLAFIDFLKAVFEPEDEIEENI